MFGNDSVCMAYIFPFPVDQYWKSRNPSNFRFGLDGLHYSYMSYFLSCSSQGDFLIWCIIWEKGLSHLLLIKWRRSSNWGLYYTIKWEKKLSHLHLIQRRRCIFGWRFVKKILIFFLFFPQRRRREIQNKQKHNNIPGIPLSSNSSHLCLSKFKIAAAMIKM